MKQKKKIDFTLKCAKCGERHYEVRLAISKTGEREIRQLGACAVKKKGAGK